MSKGTWCWPSMNVRFPRGSLIFGRSMTRHSVIATTPPLPTVGPCAPGPCGGETTAQPGWVSRTKDRLRRVSSAVCRPPRGAGVGPGRRSAARRRAPPSAARGGHRPPHAVQPRRVPPAEPAARSAPVRLDHVVDGRLVGSLAGVGEGDELVSGYSAPFGGPDFVRGSETVDVGGRRTPGCAVDEAAALGFSTVRIKARPAFYCRSEDSGAVRACSTSASPSSPAS